MAGNTDRVYSISWKLSIQGILYTLLIYIKLLLKTTNKAFHLRVTSAFKGELSRLEIDFV